MAEQARTANQPLLAGSSSAGGEGGGRPGWLEMLDGLTQSQAFRQLAALIGLAALISFAAAFFLWSGQGGGMQPLYGNLAPQDAAQVVEALRTSGVKYEIDPASGQILVPAEKLHEVRLQLAGQGLPGGAPIGFESLFKEPGLGVSQFMETARYQKALENELAATIASLSPVQSARVHLAMPKQSVFVRERQPATASVVVKLYPGRTLDTAQVQSIVNLVASSVPNMKPTDVTVVDQSGRLLSEDIASGAMALSGRQFEYRRRVEENYVARIEELLQPLLGLGRVRAQVNAELDLAEREGTSERYGPGEGKVRSEQLNEQTSTLGSGQGLGGVPGALTNQPPGGGTTTPPGAGIGPQPPLTPEQYLQMLEMPAQTDKSQTRNYELDREIQHTKVAPGEIKRLTVAVVLDDRVVTGEGGAVERRPLTDEELAKFTQLVKEAVGFDEQRGDRVTVSNMSFAGEEAVEEVPIYAQPWVWNTAKQVLLGLAALIVFLLLARPLLRILLSERRPAVQAPAKGAALPSAGQKAALPGAGATPSASAPQALEAPEEESVLGLLPGSSAYVQKIESLRRVVEQDPRLIAAVIKNWAHEDER